MKVKTINPAASALAKLRHKKSPNSKEFYVEFSRKGVEARKAKRETVGA